MSTNYVQRCRQSILPRSKSDTLSGAFEEWEFTGDVRDRRMQGECHLCGHNPLRWHFLIESGETGENLWVGSECIKNFAEHRAEERGNDPEQAREDAHKRLRERRQKYQSEVALGVMRKMWKRDDGDFRETIRSIAEHFKQTGKVSPKQAKFLCWRAGECDINLPVGYLKVNLAKNKYKRQMESMPDWQIEQFWDGLGPHQQDRAEKRGWVSS